MHAERREGMELTQHSAMTDGSCLEMSWALIITHPNFDV